MADQKEKNYVEDVDRNVAVSTTSGTRRTTRTAWKPV